MAKEKKKERKTKDELPIESSCKSPKTKNKDPEVFINENDEIILFNEGIKCNKFNIKKN